MRTRCFYAGIARSPILELSCLLVDDIGILTFVGICVLASWLLWEMGNARSAILTIRTQEDVKEEKTRTRLRKWLRRAKPKAEEDKNKINLKTVIENYKKDENHKKEKLVARRNRIQSLMTLTQTRRVLCTLLCTPRVTPRA